MKDSNHGTLIIIGMASSILSLILLLIIFILCLLGATKDNSESSDQPTIEGSQVCLQLKLKNVEPGQVGVETGAYNG